MEGLILNKDFQTECIIDDFESFIWTERFSSPGDFEIYMPVKQEKLEYISLGKYVWIRDSNRLMIIEDYEITTDQENGPHITVTGRSLESLLERRIVTQNTEIDGNLQNGIEDLLEENVYPFEDSDRTFSNLQFIPSTDSRITDLTLTASFFGETILEILEDVCTLYNIGFRMTYEDGADKCFKFQLYYGEDRSYAQETNPWVVFSPKYDNLTSSQYYESDRNLKTFALVAGDSYNEYGQEIVSVNGIPGYIGYERRELFVDASDIDVPTPEVDEDAIRSNLMSKDENTTEAVIQQAISAAKRAAYLELLPTYRLQLEQRGYEELAKTYITKLFEGTIEASRQYIYGKDFFLGDIVQIQDQYGKEAFSRITEVVRAHDVSGEQISPTFTSLAEGIAGKEE